MIIISIRKHRAAQSVVEYALLIAISLIAVLGMSSYLTRIKEKSAIKNHFERVKRHIVGR